MPNQDRRPNMDGSSPQPPKKIDRSLAEQQINENLRRIYQQKLEEDVPDHLQQLLQRLREQDQPR